MLNIGVFTGLQAIIVFGEVAWKCRRNWLRGNNSMLTLPVLRKNFFMLQASHDCEPEARRALRAVGS